MAPRRSVFRVGVVGLQRGHGLLRALKSHPQVQITALCDLDPEVLADLGRDLALSDEALFTEFSAFLADAPVDIVTIATPIEFHADQTVLALESGRHVLCEQTMAYTVADCQRIIDAVKQSGRQYMMAENYTYYHYVREWKKLIDARALGDIVYAEAEYLHDIADLLIDPATGARRWRATRPPIWYCGHCLGPILTLLDDRVVRGTGIATKTIRFPGESAAFVDMEVGLFQTAKGRLVKILRSQTVRRYPHLVWYAIYGTKGFVENGREGGPMTTGLHFLEGTMDEVPGAQNFPSPTSDPSLPPEALQGGHGTSEYLMVREFIASIAGDASPPIDAVRAADFTVPGLIAHESAIRGGVWLDVPQLG